MTDSAIDKLTDVLYRPRVLIVWVTMVALIRFFNLGFLDLQGWDEGLYALRSKSIVQFGDWLDQTSSVPGGISTGCYPPLTFWTTALFYKLFGASEWTTRLTSALFGAASVFILVLLGRRLLGPGPAGAMSPEERGEGPIRTGAFTGALFGLNLFTTFYTRQGQLDAAYIFFLILAAYGWVLSSGEGGGMKGLTLVVLGTCGAFMSKILVGLYIPLILLPLEAAGSLGGRRWHGLIRLSAAIAVGVLLALPWHVMMYLRYSQSFLDAYFGLHLWQRLAAPIEGHHPALGVLFYINQLVVRYPESALGLGLLVFFIVRRTERTSTAVRLVALAGVWGGIVFVITAIMATKIPHYILPIGVPVALFGGFVLARLSEGRLDRRQAGTALLLLAVATFWSALWPLREIVKSDVLGMTAISPYRGLPWPGLLLAAVCTGVSCYTFFRRSSWETVCRQLRLFPVVFLGLMTLQVALEVIVTDRTHYNVGTGEVASLLRSQGAQQVIYLGKDLNPALDLYLKGWETWRTDIRLEYYLSEATALAPKSTRIDDPGGGETTFLVEEVRVKGEENFTNLRSIKGDALVLFANSFYRVYRLTAVH